MHSVICVVLLSLGILGNLAEKNNTKPGTLSDIQLVTNANTLFATEFYKVLGKIVPDNLIVSPFSFSNLLVMLRAGAGPVTGQAIQNGLRLGDAEASQIYNGYADLLASFKTDPNVTLETANSVYVDKAYDIRDEYLDLLRSKFSASADALDFSNGEEVAKKVNDFVKESTKNTILELIKPSTITKDTKAVLVNGIYFKGLWKNPFDTRNTKTENFYTGSNDESTVSVDMMKQKTKFAYAKIPELNAAAAMLPYIGERFSLVVVLPNERNGLQEVESKLGTFPLSSIPKKLKTVLLHLSLPKFRLETTLDLIQNKAMDNLEMSAVTSKQADFSGISAGNGLYLGQVLQKAVLEINEEGTVAAAASAGILVNRVAQIAIPFNVDHPFIGFIYDSQTRTILFVFKKTN